MALYTDALRVQAILRRNSSRFAGCSPRAPDLHVSLYIDAEKLYQGLD